MHHTNLFRRMWFPIFFIGMNISFGSATISIKDLTSIFESMSLDHARDPISLTGVETRNATQLSLQTEFSRIASAAGGSVNGHQDLKQSYETKVYNSYQKVETVVGTNYVVVLKGSKNKSEDEPLLILGNYDTDLNPSNPLDDNGSGVVAIIALGRYLATQISAKKIKLERSVILAATDTAVTKNEFGAPTNATTGAKKLINWLQEFLKGRKKFAGAIVLDSIMNFDDSSRSQVDLSSAFNKSFPTAYKTMSESEFKGNFLALVQKESELDTRLAKSFERSWVNTKKQSISSSKGGQLIDPKLIKFIFSSTETSENSEAELHFLKSEQTSFWNHGGQNSTFDKDFPAILLTDTQKYRKSACSRPNEKCTYDVVATSKNLAFLQKNVIAIYSTILEMQTTDGFKDNGVSKANFSIFTLLLLLVGVWFH